ncbi:MAG: hypothetical protein F2916_03285 [Actinobacteria bacterium]|uniref:Unannotated protein n=1 Tax=freshwater metagenome TaxID=449393 RepID=A0A6J6UZ09_9ZZZZ|nr:hypothetical protein [Actinomycetota bacterium]MSZ80915.1 hypothetical protein [Actinomycetota bacterium]
MQNIVTLYEVMIFQFWGATPEEIDSPVVGDDICSDATLIATRSITISAPPQDVFPWLRQMGFGRAGWYSYDWLDNLGRKSATTIHEEWQIVKAGDKVPSGPISFTAAIVEAPRHFVLEIRSLGKKRPKLHFTLAYELRDDPQGTRLVTRMRSRIDFPFGSLVEKLILGPGDGFMLRRQLLTIKKNVSHNAEHN